MPFNLKIFLHGLADAIEADAEAVIAALRGLGVPGPAAVAAAVEVGAQIVADVTAPQTAPPPFPPDAVKASIASGANPTTIVPATDEHGGAILGK